MLAAVSFPDMVLPTSLISSHSHCHRRTALEARSLLQLHEQQAAAAAAKQALQDLQDEVAGQQASTGVVLFRVAAPSTKSHVRE